MRRIFVICRYDGDPKNPHDYSCYTTHGEKCGMSDAVGYDTAAHARKFQNVTEAQNYIDSKMPEWGRDIHHVAEVRPWDVLLAGLPLFAFMCTSDEPIPDALLEPTQNRLLIWRR